MARRENARWELLDGDPSEVGRDDIRFVPLGTLLGADETLVAITILEDGAGLQRATASAPWQPWTPPPERKVQHTRAFVCDCVFRRERTVHLVLREPDAWQLLCADGGHDKPHLVGLSHLVEADETLHDVLDLPEFWRAERASLESAWTRRPWTDEERRDWDDESS